MTENDKKEFRSILQEELQNLLESQRLKTVIRSEVDAGIDTFTQVVARGFVGVDKRFDKIDMRFDRVEDRLDRVEMRLNSLENRENQQDNLIDRNQDNIRLIKTSMNI
jgi:hypothetical protein